MSCFVTTNAFSVFVSCKCMMTYYILQVYKCDPMSRRLQNQELMNICEDFSRFIMKEIIHFDGKYFDPKSELAQP